MFEPNGNQLETRYTSGVERVVRNQTLLLKLLIPLTFVSLHADVDISHYRTPRFNFSLVYSDRRE